MNNADTETQPPLRTYEHGQIHSAITETKGLLLLASMLLSDAWSTQALAAEAERDLDSRVLCGGGSQPPAHLSSPNSFSRYNPDNLSLSLSLSPLGSSSHLYHLPSLPASPPLVSLLLPQRKVRERR